jgi:endonuclease/exonuclease/phosphatase family metal-dependent hydrolase
MVKIASYNVENLYERPNALDTTDWSIGQPILDAYKEVNTLFENNIYSTSDKKKMLDLLVKLDIYTKNDVGVIRRKNSISPRWAWLRKNRGKFDSEPKDKNLDVRIIADGRNDWIGWVELAKSPTDEICTRLTAQVIKDVNADIIGIVEAEDRPSLVMLNKELLGKIYEHVMLIDGNDERGIDVGIMTKKDFTIESIQSNVDKKDATGLIFSRDCPQYTIRTPNGTIVHILVNHLKSQSGGQGDTKRIRQAKAIREIADKLIDQNQHVIVMGDFNEGPKVAGQCAPNLAPLYDNNSRLVDCYSLNQFQTGSRPGTFDSCGLSNRFDYIMISKSLVQSFKGGSIFRNGLWGSSRVNRPTDWVTYPQMTNSTQQASDHALVYIELDI